MKVLKVHELNLDKQQLELLMLLYKSLLTSSKKENNFREGLRATIVISSLETMIWRSNFKNNKTHTVCWPEDSDGIDVLLDFVTQKTYAYA